MSDLHGSTPLHLAVRNGHVGVVELLLKLNANPFRLDKKQCSPFHIAAGWDDDVLTRLLLTRVKDVSELIAEEITPLFIAAAYGSVGVVAVYLEAFKDRPEMRSELVNKTDRWGMTALSIAAENGHEKIVDLLKDLTTATAFESLQNAPFAGPSNLNANWQAHQNGCCTVSICFGPRSIRRRASSLSVE